MGEIPPARVQEGRRIAVVFDFPPQLRVEGDLVATTTVVVQTALAFAVALHPEFQEFATVVGDHHSGEGVMASEWDERRADMFTRMTRDHLFQFFSAVTM